MGDAERTRAAQRQVGPIAHCLAKPKAREDPDRGTEPLWGPTRRDVDHRVARAIASGTAAEEQEAR